MCPLGYRPFPRPSSAFFPCLLVMLREWRSMAIHVSLIPAHPVCAHSTSFTPWCSSFPLFPWCQHRMQHRKEDFVSPAVIPVHRESWLALVLFKGWDLRGSIKEPIHELHSYFPQEQTCWEHQQLLPTCPDTGTRWHGDSHTLFSLAGAVPGYEWWRAELSLLQGSCKCLQHVILSRLAWEILFFQCDLLQKMLFWWLALWWCRQDKSARSFVQCFVVWSLSSLMLFDVCRIPLGAVEGSVIPITVLTVVFIATSWISLPGFHLFWTPPKPHRSSFCFLPLGESGNQYSEAADVPEPIAWSSDSALRLCQVWGSVCDDTWGLHCCKHHPFSFLTAEREQIMKGVACISSHLLPCLGSDGRWAEDSPWAAHSGQCSAKTGSPLLWFFQ